MVLRDPHFVVSLAPRRHAVGMNEHLRKSLQESDADGNGDGYQGKLSEGFDICKKGFRRD